MATIPEALAIAIQHHRAGRLQAAEQIYRQILAVEPNHADAWHLLGVIAHQAGQHDLAIQHLQRAIALEGNSAIFHNNLGGIHYALRRFPEAAACYRRAVELQPDHAEGYYNLGNALKDLGKLDEAIACYRRALELKPDFAEAHNNLGNLLKDQGRLDEAVACYRRTAELRPADAEAHNNLGNVLRDQGKRDEALVCYRRALDRRPEFADAHYNLGDVLKELGEIDEAVACYRRALELKPDLSEAHNNLGAALEVQGKLDEAVACYRRALELKPDHARAYNNLGAVLDVQGKLDEAVACYRRALQLKPDFAEAHGNLGAALEETGDFAAAEERFRTALRHDGRFAFAHYKLAELLGRRLPEQDLAALRLLLDETQLTDAQRLLLHFGLAQALDARAEYAQAAWHLEQANAIQASEWRRRGQEYDPSDDEFLVTQLISVCGPDFFQRVRGFGLETELPVFVVGLPRSGTTLVEQILASHSQVYGAGEIALGLQTMAALGEKGAELIEGLRRLDRATTARLAARHLEQLRALHGTAERIVDKMPDNFFSLGLLAALFPRAKLIHCRRDLRDVAVSCWMTHFREVRWANDPSHMASRFHQYRRLMTHWRNVLPVPLLEVDYEETVADVEGVARKLLAHCGLAWEPACLEFQRAKRPVRTASTVRVRQPVFKTSVERWKHYQEALAPLFARLEEAEDRR
jgi:tetratricopeptide (TPR) repeat protein